MTIFDIQRQTMATNACPTCPEITCLNGLDCSKCPAAVYPDQYPPINPGQSNGLATVLVPYVGDNCWLNQTGNNPLQQCYYNQFQTTYTPNPGGRFLSHLPENTIIGVSSDSLLGNPTRCDQIYLTAPFDNLRASQIEFLLAPPDAQGNSQPSYFDSHSPTQCTVPQCDCTTRCMYDGSMPCVTGTAPIKVGPVLTSPDWKGWTMQGYQCVPQTYGCNFNTGHCELQAGGPFSSLEACQSQGTCIACPSVGFKVIKDASNNPQCYRVPYNAPKGDCYDNCENHPFAVCIGTFCDETNSSACGPENGWQPNCGNNCYALCNDTLTTPQGAWQCTNQGYVKCNSPGGCRQDQFDVNTAAGCVLPKGSVVLREASLVSSQNPWLSP